MRILLLLEEAKTLRFKRTVQVPGALAAKRAGRQVPEDAGAGASCTLEGLRRVIQ